MYSTFNHWFCWKRVKRLQQLPLYLHIYSIAALNSKYSPQGFKLANVTPIYKKGEHSNKNNYGPISVLPVLSLIFEKNRVNLYLKSYLESNKWLYSRQSGFRSNHSCQTAPIKMINEWLKLLINDYLQLTTMK